MATEKRLTDANALLEEKTILWDEALGFCECVLVDDIVKAPTVDAVEVVRCKDCKNFKPAHFKADDGTETPWDETFSWDNRSDGIYHGGKCKHDRNTAYGQKDMAFRKPDDFCSYGERRTE